MKKILYLSLIISLLFSTSSCLFDEELAFDESSAKRKNDFMDAAKDSLISAENGWVMYYFPDQDSKGYTFLLKCYENGNAIIATANQYTKNKFAISDGLWAILGDNGPVLSFNTYIDIFTMFADPVAPDTGTGGTGGPGGGDGTGSTQTSDGKGLNGDYEFNILSHEKEGIIELKGKKRGTRILMRKSPVQFDENNDQSWREFLEERDKDSRETFFSGSPVLHMHIGDSIFHFKDAGNGVFTIVNPKAPLDIAPDYLPFVMLPDGIRFSDYYEKESSNEHFKFIQMNFDETRQILFDPLNKSTKLIPESTYAYLQTTTDNYFGDVNLGQITGNLKTIFEKVAAESLEKNSAKETNPMKILKGLGFKFDKENDKVYMTIQSERGTVLTFPIPGVMDVENETFEVHSFDVDALEFTTSITGESNASALYNGTFDKEGKPVIVKVDSVRELLQAIQGKYTITTKEPFKMDKVTYTKIDTEGDSVEIERKRNV